METAPPNTYMAPLCAQAAWPQSGDLGERQQRERGEWGGGGACYAFSRGLSSFQVFLPALRVRLRVRGRGEREALTNRVLPQLVADALLGGAAVDIQAAAEGCGRGSAGRERRAQAQTTLIQRADTYRPSSASGAAMGPCCRPWG